MKSLALKLNLFSRPPGGPQPRLVRDFVLVEQILRNRERFLVEISHSIDLRRRIRAMLVASSIFMAAYGALLGSTHSLWQTLSSAAKLPLLFLATLIICAPALYILNMLFGTNQSLMQSIALVLTAISVTSLLLLSFAPITLFFLITVIGHYQFFKLLNVFFFMIAGAAGASLLKEGMQIVSTATDREAQGTSLPFYLWATVYIFVGSQMAWTLRPFVGYPELPFELFRQLGGNFYADILASLGEILGFFIVK